MFIGVTAVKIKYFSHYVICTCQNGRQIPCGILFAIGVGTQKNDTHYEN